MNPGVTYPFGPADWLSDPRLGRLSPAIRGTWLDLLSAVLLQDGCSMTLRGTCDDLARIARCSTALLRETLTDLQSLGVALVEERNGFIEVTPTDLSVTLASRNRHVTRHAASRDDLQNERDASSNEKRELDRQRALRYRQRKRERHASVTLASRDASRSDGICISINTPRELIPGEEREAPKDKNSGFSAEINPESSRASEINANTPKNNHKSTSSQFDLWWKSYPKKVGKQGARAAYDRAVKRIATDRGITTSEAHKALLATVTAFAESDKAKGQYCPHPATWLNEGRYDDDPETWRDNANDPRGNLATRNRFLEKFTHATE